MIALGVRKRTAHANARHTQTHGTRKRTVYRKRTAHRKFAAHVNARFTANARRRKGGRA